MKQTPVFFGVALTALAFLAVSARQAASQIQVIPAFVRLQSSTPGTPQAGHLNVTGTAIAGQFQGAGGLLTGLNATNVSSGTFADARLSTNIPKLNAANTFSNNNGFGGAPTANRVHVVGNADVTGNLDAGSITVNPSPREYVVGALDFVDCQNSINFLDDPTLTNSNGAKSLYAPIHLPDGATVTSFSCFIQDFDNNGDTTVYLIRRLENTGQPGGTMAQFTSAGVANQRLTDTTISAPIVDNGGFIYYVRVDLPGDAGTNVSMVSSIHITYTVTSPLP